MKKSILITNFLQYSRFQLHSHKHLSNQVKSFSEIPKAKGLPLIGTLLDYTKFRNFNPLLLHKLFEKRHKELGSIFRENLPGSKFTTVFTSSPDDVETLFRNEGSTPVRPPIDIISKSRDLSGLHRGIACAQGEEWQRLRRVYNQVINNKNVWAYASQHMETSSDLVDYVSKNLNNKSEVPDFDYILYKWALECTIRFSLDMKLNAFSENIASEAKIFIKASSKLFEMFSKLIFSAPTWKYFNTKDLKELKKWQDLQISSLEQYIKNNGDNLSSTSVIQQFFSSSDLNMIEKKTIVYEIVAAGVETTSNSVPFLLYCLATNPEKQEKLRSELMELNSRQEISGKAFQQLEYLHAVHLESQRLFPLTTFNGRITVTDTILSGYLVPTDTVVYLTANIMNNDDPRYFDKPKDFIPERWLEKDYSRQKRFFLSGSFGMGPRMCPGRKLALQEIGSLLTALLGRYKIQYRHEPFELSFNLTSKPFQKPNFTFLPL